MARAAGMDDEPRPRQPLHQLPGAACVVEVDVGEDHVVDGVRRDAEGVEGREQVRHRVARPDVDERGTAALDDQVARVEERPLESRVDGDDAVAEVLVSHRPDCDPVRPVLFYHRWRERHRRPHLDLLRLRSARPAARLRVPLRCEPRAVAGLVADGARRGPPRSASRPVGWRGLWRSLPADVKALALAAALVMSVGLAWLTFGPSVPNDTPALLGYVERPVSARRPGVPPAPPFKLPWWK